MQNTLLKILKSPRAAPTIFILAVFMNGWKEVKLVLYVARYGYLLFKNKSGSEYMMSGFIFCILRTQLDIFVIKSSFAFSIEDEINFGYNRYRIIALI